ncbi:arginine deiminase [Pseudalkalibacillus caeni]|uniref:Arginine deiminase n=1 Tax=Exobacillus caeni TaxID=2574798 RepID=A0A5R9F6W3_9BACL|nr:arginine deiminase [Pseudalkalibacillus caeni]TLS38771.1 arginine deiminase [Pseudalkalibacillus caeni]
MKKPIHITSEIGTLKKVLLHRPGKEIDNLTPEYLERLLFDDIPFLPKMQEEHDQFAETLRNRGIEVVYLENLTAEALRTEELRRQFVEKVLYNSKYKENGAYEHLKNYLLDLPNDELVQKVMSGVLKKEIQKNKRKHLYEIMEAHDPFYLDPMPNLVFTRDPAAGIGNGVSISRMYSEARRRESQFVRTIINHHPDFTDDEIPEWFSEESLVPMEGGDQLVLSDRVVAVGVSARTSPLAIEKLAENLLNSSGYEKVVAIEIPKSRAFMHLDTVFTMVDHDKFAIHHAIQGPAGKMNIYILEKGADGEMQIEHRENLSDVLKEVLSLKSIVLIPCGGGDRIDAAREQWNDGSNTLAIAPGVVVTYDRNVVTNRVLREHGIEVLEVPSSELARGRGGPRCMSMPLVRASLSD